VWEFFILLLRLNPQRSEMTDYLDIPIGRQAPEIVTAVIEIPHGGINKYEYDKKLHVFRLDRNLYSPVHYPGGYGFIPRTVAEDGDPLDILVLGDAPTFPGCVYSARPIGLFEMLDQGIRDEKIVAYATGNPRFTGINDYTEVQPHIVREVAHFFSICKDLEGKRTKVLGWKDRDAAHEIIQLSHTRFGAGS
jgi:inorganic pyrophosphatase